MINWGCVTLTKKAQRDDHNTVRLPEDLTDEMDKLIGKHGFRSRAEIAKQAIRTLLREYQGKESALPTRFGHYNISDFGARITDSKSELMADIYFKPEGVWCDLDQTNDCEHIDYALTVPKIQKIIRQHKKEGWKLPDV